MYKSWETAYLYAYFILHFDYAYKKRKYSWYYYVYVNNNYFNSVVHILIGNMGNKISIV